MYRQKWPAVATNNSLFKMRTFFLSNYDLFSAAFKMLLLNLNIPESVTNRFIKEPFSQTFGFGDSDFLDKFCRGINLRIYRFYCGQMTLEMDLLISYVKSHFLTANHKSTLKLGVGKICQFWKKRTLDFYRKLTST